MSETLHIYLEALQEHESVITADGVSIHTVARKITVRTSDEVLRSSCFQLFNEHRSFKDVIDHAAQSSDALTGLYSILQRCLQDNSLRIEYRIDDVPAGLFLPMGLMPLIADVQPFSGVFHLSRFAMMHRSMGTLTLEAPVAAARFEIYDPTLTSQLSVWLSQESIKVEQSILARILIIMGLAFPVDDSALSAERRMTELNGWTIHEAYFQFRSRYGYSTYPNGAYWFGAGQRPAPAASRIAIDCERRMSLPRPSTVRTSSLEDVIERRRSTREFEQLQPSIEDLSELFWRTMRQIEPLQLRVTAPDGSHHEFPLKRRPVPSGGSVHEVDVYLLVANDGAIPRGLWRYDDEQHELVFVSALNDKTNVIQYRAMISAGLQAPPQMIILFAARFDRMMWKYTAMSLGAIYKHVGVLYEIFYLVATDIGLGICGLGSGDTAAFADIIGSHPAIESSVGEMIIGIPKR